MANTAGDDEYDEYDEDEDDEVEVQQGSVFGACGLSLIYPAYK